MFTYLHSFCLYPSFYCISLFSGAVYRGEWVDGLKEGRGTFTFKNGESFAGVFHRDRISSSRETDEEEREVFPRPKTPLGTLIGTYTYLRTSPTYDMT